MLRKKLVSIMLVLLMINNSKYNVLAEYASKNNLVNENNTEDSKVEYEDNENTDKNLDIETKQQINQKIQNEQKKYDQTQKDNSSKENITNSTNNKNVDSKKNITSGLSVNARAGILMEPTTGQILFEQNSHNQLPPASVTKVMTLLLIYDSISDGKIKWDDIVAISDHAANMGGSQVFLEPSEQQKVSDLVKSIVVASANDAAVAMAEYIAGSEESFVSMMNEKAKKLGMKDTNFINACGLDTDGHVTSANDIALMSRELITKHPEVLDLTQIWMDTIVHKTSRGETEFGLSNTNKLLRTYNGATGLKTGSTSQALFCISATAERDGLSLIAVILGSPDSATRFEEARKLLDYGFANYTVTKGDPVGTKKDIIPIYKGNKDTVDLVVKEQINMVAPKGKNIHLETKIEKLTGVNAPVKKGTKVGEIIYLSNGKEVGRSDLITKEDIEKSSLINMMRKLLLKWFS